MGLQQGDELPPRSVEGGRDAPARRVIGLMSGTSADGVDAALVEIRGRGLHMAVRVVDWLTEPLAEDLRQEILQASQPGAATVADLARLHARLGHAYASAVHALVRRAFVPLAQIACIGCHGQTVWHEPGAAFPTTLQLGAAAVLAERTGVSVISDFRWRDLAVGGQGAPLVPVVDWLLLRMPGVTRVAVNLGGIINLTYLPAGGRLEDVLAFDVGPGNMVLDRLTQELTRGKERYDAGGRLAVQGRQIKPLLRHWADHPFLQRRPPKSTGREEFGESFVREALELAARKNWSVVDVLCTATYFSAACLADAVTRFLPGPSMAVRSQQGEGAAGRERRSAAPAAAFSAGGVTSSARTQVSTGPHPELLPFSASGRMELIVSGGGVHNGLLLRAIGERLSQCTVLRSDAFGLPVDAKEAVAFAVLACLAVDAVPGNVPSATGASAPRILGSFTPGSPENWRRLLERVTAV